ncbi:MAG: SIS domain-containing protein [Thermoplasmata archaeon]
MSFKDAAEFLVDHVETVFQEDFEEAVGEALAFLASAPKIFVYGVGRSGLVGKAFAMRMVQLGLRVFFIGETITPIVEPGDVVVIVSRTGETMSAIQTANIVRRVGGHVIAVTAQPGSKLAKASSLVLAIREPGDREAPRHAPLGTLFEESTFLFLDALISLLMEKLGQTEEDMRGRHAIMV